MRTIRKYTLNPEVSQTIAMPQGAQVLCVGMRGITMYLWAEVVCERPDEKRHFEIYDEGHSVDTTIEKTYIGPVFQNSCVLHVFENTGGPMRKRL